MLAGGTESGPWLSLSAWTGKKLRPGTGKCLFICYRY
jgi:hypothetical protein